MKAVVAALGALILAGCAAGGSSSIYRPGPNDPAPVPGPLPAGFDYGSAIGAGEVAWSARTLAADLTQIAFRSESRKIIAKPLRWRGPIRIATVGDGFAPYRRDLEDLVARLSAASPHLDLAVDAANDAETAQIILREASRTDIMALNPTALCVFTPFRGDIGSYRARREENPVDWSNVEISKAVTIYIPDNAAPAEMRSCLAEEITQALGLRNDLFRLEDTIFNDDNAHSQPTATDLLMLRALYDPAMDGVEVQTAFERIARETLTGLTTGESRRSWRPVSDRAFQAAYLKTDKAKTTVAFRAGAAEMREVVEAFPANDHRNGVALVVEGVGFVKAKRYDSAVKSFAAAKRRFAGGLGAESLRAANAGRRMGEALFFAKRYAEAIAELESVAPILAAHAKSRELAQALRFTALSHARLDRNDKGRRAARQAIDWAAYAFGVDGPAVRRWRAQFKRFGVDPGARTGAKGRMGVETTH